MLPEDSRGPSRVLLRSVAAFWVGMGVDAAAETEEVGRSGPARRGSGVQRL